MQPLAFLAFFAIMWIFVTGLLGNLSGWQQLAQQFPTNQNASGEEFRFASGSIGASQWFPVNYRNCLCFTMGDNGFELSLLFLFRFQNPPLFIPWSAVESVQEEKQFFVRQQVIKIRSSETKIKVQGNAGKKIAEYYALYLAKKSG